jgi:hypothetical protein
MVYWIDSMYESGSSAGEQYSQMVVFKSSPVSTGLERSERHRKGHGQEHRAKKDQGLVWRAHQNYRFRTGQVMY